MTVRTSILGAVLAATLVLAGCGSDATVAEVNGRAISYSDVTAMFQGPTVPMADFVSVLQLIALEQLVAPAARDEYGIEVAPEAVQAEVDALVARLQDQGLDYQAELESAGVTEAFVAMQTRISLLGVELEQQALPDVNTWVTDLLSGADVQVAERYGEWRSEPSPGIYPLEP